MILGISKIIYSLFCALVSVIAVEFVMKFMTTIVVLEYLQKSAFSIAAFFAAATYLRGKLSDLLNDDSILSYQETRDLRLILVVRRARLTKFLLACLMMVLLLALAPFFAVLPEQLLRYTPHILVVGFVELIYFFSLILLSIDEVEKLRDKLRERAKKSKQREDNLARFSED